jgi:putative nucleotidyltransferase with HDIG domain
MLIDGPPVRVPEPAPGPTQELDAPASALTDYIAPAPTRHLPHMLLATTLVAVLPLAVSLTLRATGVISGWVSVGLAVATSLVASAAGSAYWRKRDAHDEVLFSELLLWGWLRSWRLERELANATQLLDLANGGPNDRDELSIEQRERLLRQLAGALEGQDVYLSGHSRRVARHATMIARGMGLSSEDVARIRAAAAVHDIGKLRTPRSIINKPGRLTDEEFEIIKRHPVDGANMVAALGDPELTRIVRHHHERLDGAGYPDRLNGENIPLGARIIAVADTFDAITSARPYRDAAPHQKAIDILRKESGTQLDPDAVKAFLAYYSGNRPALVWAIVTSSVRRLVAWLTGDPAAAATISAGKVAAVTMATATIGAVAAAAPLQVMQQAPRPVSAHAVTAPHRSTATGLGRPGVSVALPPPAPAGTTQATKTGPAKPRQRAGQHAAAGRHGTPATDNQSHSSTVGAGNGSPGASGATTPAGFSSAAAPTQTSSHSQSVANRAVSGTAGGTATATGTPTNQPASAGHSQGSGASGNAYGHSKPLGNGNGQGVANGHGDGSSSATPASHGNGNANSNGNANGNANANGNGNGNGNGNAQTDPAPAATPSTSTSPGNSGNAPGHTPGSANGNGNGNGNAATQDASGNSPPNGNGNGNGNANGAGNGHGSSGNSG